MQALSAVLVLGASLHGMVAAGSQEVILSKTETPDRTTVCFIDDTANSGEVSGGPAGVVSPIDNNPDGSIAIGDLAVTGTPGRVRKFFLLFHLPSMPDKKLTSAVLRLRLGHTRNETPEKPLPPASLLHAKNWPDASWASDPEFHGLGSSSFADPENFDSQTDVCNASVKPDFVAVDVTQMIQGDYQRNAEPVAVFRLEVPDTFNISDEFSHSYHFFGPGQQADYVPMLQLNFD